MDKLRKPFFVAAIVLSIVTVLMELGSFVLPRGTAGSDPIPPDADNRLKNSGLNPDEQEQFLSDCRSGRGTKPPGMGIPAQVLLDGLVLYTIAMMGLALLVPQRVQGRTQGVLTLFVALLLILGSIAAIFVAYALLMVMITLIMAVPFGPIAYLVLYGGFPTGQAAVLLSVIMTGKLAFAGCLVFAHQRFLQNKSLVLLILTSLLATVVVSFLHGFVPGILVSITDALAAIIVGILALIWAILLLITSIVAVVKAIV